MKNEKMKIDSMKKITKAQKIEILKDPEFFYISLTQHIGAPALEIVNKGDLVKRYQLLGEAQQGISARIHSPISGEIVDIKEKVLPTGKITKEIIIKNDYLYTEENLVKRLPSDIDNMKKNDILSLIEKAGVVGEGGAQFPTHIKYDKKEKDVKFFILNGAECEPYLTCDYALMKEYTKEFFDGIKIVKKLLDVEKIFIAIDTEYKDLVEKFNNFLDEDIEIKLVSDIYPQGSEQLLIKTILKKEMPKTALPIDEGIIVSNVGTVKSVYDAVINGIPLVERVVTISGEEIQNPGNYLLKIGVNPEHIVENFTLKTSLDKLRIIFGGPMMGNEILELKTGVMKGTSGILFLSKKIDEIERKNCILCGYCSSVCPMNLMPMKYEEFHRKGKYEKMVKFDINSCIECGACEYICPSRVSLIESIKIGKEKIRELEGRN